MLFYRRLLSVSCGRGVSISIEIQNILRKNIGHASIKIDFHITNWGSFLLGQKYPERQFTSIAFDLGTGFLKWTVHLSETLCK
jgi:hypothetical protein